MSDASEGQTERFLLKEYDRLCVEIGHKVAELRALPRYALVTSGAIWGWLATNNVQAGKNAITWVPLFVTILLFLQNEAQLSDTRRIGKYLERTEGWFGLPKGLGWETHPQRGGQMIAWSRALWLVLIGGNLLAPFLMRSP